MLKNYWNTVKNILFGQSTKQPLNNLETRKSWKYKWLLGLDPDPSCLYKKECITVNLSVKLFSVAASGCYNLIFDFLNNLVYRILTLCLLIFSPVCIFCIHPLAWVYFCLNHFLIVKFCNVFNHIHLPKLDLQITKAFNISQYYL